MRVPIEYGDNFPVHPGSWDPAVPWRFPRVELRPRDSTLLRQVLPWLMLGLGLALGILWMIWQQGLPVGTAEMEKAGGHSSAQKIGQKYLPTPQSPSLRGPVGVAPKSRPVRVKSRLA